MADVAGFTRLMGVDDERTTSRILDFHRNVKSIIESHSGRVVATAGDSVFGEFDSVLLALDCAAEIQQNLHDSNVDIPPHDRIEARIGLHLGDVIVEEYNVFGDGVNIAARLEALAEPGGIYLSEAVFQQIEGRRDLPITEVGTRNLKNVEHPVRVYSISPDAFSSQAPPPPPDPAGEQSGALKRTISGKLLAGVAAALAAAMAVVLTVVLTGGDDTVHSADTIAITAAPATTVTVTTTTSTTSTSTTTTTTTLPVAPGEHVPDLAAMPPPAMGDTEGASGSGCVLGGEPMWDGAWYGYVTARSPAELEFDLACFFTGEEAVIAAGEDAAATSGVHYVRNQQDRTRTLPIHSQAIVYYAESGGVRWVPIAEWPRAGVSACPGDTCGTWIYLNDGQVTAIFEFHP